MNTSTTGDFFFSLDTIKRIKKNGRQTLGKGGCGKVDLVTHISSPSTKFAMKTIRIINRAKIDVILDEIRLHQSLKHPNIIQIYGNDFRNDSIYIFLEYASQGDLFSALYENKELKAKMDLKTKLRIFYECVEAIGYLHNQNILHRDLKPENILLDDQLKVKLCDFGWAIQLTQNQRRKSLCGTVEYMAPEIVHNRIQTEKTDVWALGIIIFILEFSILNSFF